jgi:hypothetical protein
MHIAFVQADSGINGDTYAHFDQSFTGFTVPAKGTANSGQFGSVLLTKGAFISLEIIPVGHLDVFAATTVTCVSILIPSRGNGMKLKRIIFLRIGDGGYMIPWLHLTQFNVPTNYDLAGLSLGNFKQAMANTNSTDKVTGPVSSALSAASHVVGSAASFVPSIATRVIGSIGTEVVATVADGITSVSLQPS